MKRIIATIQKRENVYICIGDGSLAGGYRFGEIRQFTRDSDGTLTPTQKGFTFTPDALPGIIAGLEQLRKRFLENNP